MVADNWCWASVPGYIGDAHYCHLKTHHTGRHVANLCGRGKRGGRTAMWTCEADLVIPAGGKLDECSRCRDNRKASEHPLVRVVLIDP